MRIHLIALCFLCINASAQSSKRTFFNNINFETELNLYKSEVLDDFEEVQKFLNEDEDQWGLLGAQYSVNNLSKIDGTMSSSGYGSGPRGYKLNWNLRLQAHKPLKTKNGKESISIGSFIVYHNNSRIKENLRLQENPGDGTSFTAYGRGIGHYLVPNTYDSLEFNNYRSGLDTLILPRSLIVHHRNYSHSLELGLDVRFQVFRFKNDFLRMYFDLGASYQHSFRNRIYLASSFYNYDYLNDFERFYVSEAIDGKYTQTYDHYHLENHFNEPNVGVRRMHFDIPEVHGVNYSIGTKLDFNVRNTPLRFGVTGRYVERNLKRQKQFYKNYWYVSSGCSVSYQLGSSD